MGWNPPALRRLATGCWSCPGSVFGVRAFRVFERDVSCLIVSWNHVSCVSDIRTPVVQRFVAGEVDVQGVGGGFIAAFLAAVTDDQEVAVVRKRLDGPGDGVPTQPGATVQDLAVALAHAVHDLVEAQIVAVFLPAEGVADDIEQDLELGAGEIRQLHVKEQVRDHGVVRRRVAGKSLRYGCIWHSKTGPPLATASRAAAPEGGRMLC